MDFHLINCRISFIRTSVDTVPFLTKQLLCNKGTIVMYLTDASFKGANENSERFLEYPSSVLIMSSVFHTYMLLLLEYQH